MTWATCICRHHTHISQVRTFWGRGLRQGRAVRGECVKTHFGWVRDGARLEEFGHSHFGLAYACRSADIFSLDCAEIARSRIQKRKRAFESGRGTFEDSRIQKRKRAFESGCGTFKDSKEEVGFESESAISEAGV